ncbi:hypothetical protein PTTG_00324 [Puccinia triticina 1-1 BBBD Race 1]|uniref:Ubiquilin n=2 Tax=Puccinia triticina TaxID=208348 RepID=A0A0C4EHV8_PUCT1|nr:uncharacterized protein PtA15_8A403 [Puccinia triticina]OAV98275.1 hypothetical protein PTTG_00324 [Puccinia triticina 1-1 BBBD Race 1]WAQ87499.1 hypothetical protein PtA15_8A403 [Puccinia triticina]WAR57357.1 hypothetical protein PtB15_8B404 [Puccinia triticina]
MSTSESPEPTTSSAESATEPQITINIKAPSDSKLSLSISLSKTVWDLKKLISESTNPTVEAENQRLIYSGRVLKDESLLSEYKIQSGHSIHMVKGAPRPSNPTPATQQIPSNLNAGQQIAGNPLAPLLNATNQIPGFNPFADLGINTNDPNMAMNMMNNPQVLQSAARLLEDPAIVEQMIASDPRLQSMGPQVREMLRSPMFRQMLTNPDLMRGMHGAMRGSGGASPFGDMNLAGAGGATDPIAAALGAHATTPGATAGAPPANPAAGLGGMDPLALMNSPLGQMMQQGMGFPMAAPPPADPRPPEERFEVQLGQLQGMGFTDARQNVRALLASGGSVEAAIEYILSGN